MHPPCLGKQRTKHQGKTHCHCEVTSLEENKHMQMQKYHNVFRWGLSQNRLATVAAICKRLLVRLQLFAAVFQLINYYFAPIIGSFIWTFFFLSFLYLYWKGTIWPMASFHCHPVTSLNFVEHSYVIAFAYLEFEHWQSFIMLYLHKNVDNTMISCRNLYIYSQKM